jgi:hypothetical protein
LRSAKRNPNDSATAKERRDYQLNLSLTKSELETLRLRAAAAEMHIVPYSRAVLLNEGAAPPPPPVAMTDRLTHEQLKRLGNNLNQIARFVNAMRKPPPAGLEPLLADVRAALKRGGVV